MLCIVYFNPKRQNLSFGWDQNSCTKGPFTDEPGLAANPGQGASLGQPFSSQTPVTVYMNLPSGPYTASNLVW